MSQKIVWSATCHANLLDCVGRCIHNTGYYLVNCVQWNVCKKYLFMNSVGMWFKEPHVFSKLFGQYQ